MTGDGGDEEFDLGDFFTPLPLLVTLLSDTFALSLFLQLTMRSVPSVDTFTAGVITCLRRGDSMFLLESSLLGREAVRPGELGELSIEED